MEDRLWSSVPQSSLHVGTKAKDLKVGFNCSLWILVVVLVCLLRYGILLGLHFLDFFIFCSFFYYYYFLFLEG